MKKIKKDLLAHKLKREQVSRENFELRTKLWNVTAILEKHCKSIVGYTDELNSVLRSGKRKFSDVEAKGSSSSDDDLPPAFPSVDEQQLREDIRARGGKKRKCGAGASLASTSNVNSEVITVDTSGDGEECFCQSERLVH